MSVSPQDNSFHKALEAILALRLGERFVLSGLLGSSKAFFIASLLGKGFPPLSPSMRGIKGEVAPTTNSEPRTVLIITPTQEEAENFTKDINFFLGKKTAFFYPSWEILPFESQSPHPDIIAARIDILHKLAHGHHNIIVTTSSAIMQRVIPKGVLISSVQRFEVGMEVNRDEILQRLLQIGYSRTGLVEEKGEMRVAGGILDIFPPSYSAPVRIEFFGDEIESIRTFDSATQRSKEDLKEAVILPAKEIIFSKNVNEMALDKLRKRADELELPKDVRESISDRIRDGLVFAGIDFLSPLFYERLDTLFDYLPKDCLLFLNNLNEIEEAGRGFENEVSDGRIKIEEKRQFFVKPEEFYIDVMEFKSGFEKMGTVVMEASISPGPHLIDKGVTNSCEFSTQSNLDIRQDIATPLPTLPRTGGAEGVGVLKPLVDKMKDWHDLGWSVFLVCHTTGQAERLKELLESYRLAPISSDLRLNPPFEKGGMGGFVFSILIGDLSSGFRFPSIKLAIVTEEEVFGQKVKRRPPPSHKIDAFLTQLQDLNIGDFIVHTIHGIGIYQGLKRLKIEDIENDFLLLEYQGGDKLYLPVQRLHLVGKYRGVEGKKPEIDKLGSTRWEKTKGRVKKIAEEMAKGLLELYAARKVVEGFSFSGGDRLFSEFEASFDYDETPDQISAIEDVLKDMEEPKPMDRLICGDVGYGKTEVAMRAAFKAVLDNRQVAVLVPTTLLAQQHYLTFKNRFAAYPVTIEVLSRFRSPKEQKYILKRLANGEVDIIIGTHRLLQKDVVLKDLGLIIVDEEHRFGVSHKERLKQMKRQVDVLTLSATPIPRTLHMSLAGIRDLSIINTPPEDRLAIKTVVARFDDDLIRDAVRRELARGGQVFFVHNRV